MECWSNGVLGAPGYDDKKHGLSLFPGRGALFTIVPRKNKRDGATIVWPGSAGLD